MYTICPYSICFDLFLRKSISCLFGGRYSLSEQILNELFTDASVKDTTMNANKCVCVCACVCNCRCWWTLTHIGTRVTDSCDCPKRGRNQTQVFHKRQHTHSHLSSPTIKFLFSDNCESPKTNWMWCLPPLNDYMSV